MVYQDTLRLILKCRGRFVLSWYICFTVGGVTYVDRSEVQDETVHTTIST